MSGAFGFLGGSEGKVSACSAGDPGSIPGSGRFPGEGNGNPLQYSCLENSMEGGAWKATAHGVAKSRTRLSDFPFLSNDYTVEVISQFKGLDLEDRVPKELWVEVDNTVQEVVTKTTPRNRNARRQSGWPRKLYR